MEGRMKVAALAACMLILLSGQVLQVAGMSKFCNCYWKSYPGCRKEHKPSQCKIRCCGNCISHKQTGGDGREICDDTAATGDAMAAGPTDADVAACVDDCTGYYL